MSKEIKTETVMFQIKIWKTPIFKYYKKIKKKPNKFIIETAKDINTNNK